MMQPIHAAVFTAHIVLSMELLTTINEQDLWCHTSLHNTLAPNYVHTKWESRFCSLLSLNWVTLHLPVQQL